MELSDTSPTSVYGTVAWFPDLAVGPDGSVHVIWGGSKTVGKKAIDALEYREFRGGKWSTVNDIADTGIGGYTVRNSMVMGRDGKLHVLVRIGTDIAYIGAPWDNAWSARSWSSPHSVGGGYYNALAMDSKGTLHALRTEIVVDDPEKPRKGCPNCAFLFYRHSNDAGQMWSPSVNLSAGFEGANRPQIKVDQFDRIHVVWDEGFDWYAGKGEPKTGVYRRSDDGGLTWTPPVTFSLPEDTIQQTALALTADGNPFVVYRSVKNGGIYFQRSGDGGSQWSEPAEVPGVLARSINDPNLDIYSLATDSADKIHLVMVGFRVGSTRAFGVPSLLHLVWNGNTWSTPEVIMESDTYPEWPRIAIGNGNTLYVVWFTRNDLYSENRVLRVWYSQKVLDAPEATPLPTFTPTPTRTPTMTPQLTSTPTPFAKISPQNPDDHGIFPQPKPDSEAVVVLLLGGIPVIALTAIIWAMRRARR